MLFIRSEYPINEKVDDILSWLEKDMQIIESFEGEKIKVTYHRKRDGNAIEVFHKVWTKDENPAQQGSLSFSFEVEKITDTKSLIIGKYQDENIYIEKLYYTYLARLGGAFFANFKESAMKRLEEIRAEIEKERGGHLGWTDWKVNEKTGFRARSYGFIPNNPKPVPATKIDKENITIGELEELVQAGNKEAIELWEIELAPLLEEVRKSLILAIKKTFDNDPAKPFFEMLNNMATSKNVIHRAIVQPYDNWSLAEIREYGAKMLANELSKSANELPASVNSIQPDNKLTIRQIDSIVQSNLFVIKGWEHERKEQGATILYTIWTNAISPKLYLGVFRVWEWTDGSGRCGWQPLPEVTPEQKKLRDFFYIEMIMPLLVKANTARDNQGAKQVVEPPTPESKVLPRIPKQAKRLNDWKVAWRKVKGKWKGGDNYKALSKIAGVSPETIADIVKAGDAGLLD